MKHAIRLTVNGQAYEGSVEPRTSLADFLRDDLDLTGTHVGCEHGVCGACTVLLEGEPVRSCLLLAIQADGRAIMTVEAWQARTENFIRFKRHFVISMHCNVDFARLVC